ncbi:MAG TPA: hypothetical protein VGM64_14650 [Lacunisphaera sp.]|jgi:hypothetical protein
MPTTTFAAAHDSLYYVQALEDEGEFFCTQDVVNSTVDALPLGNAVSYNMSSFPVTATAGAIVNFSADCNQSRNACVGDEPLPFFP